MLHSEFMSAERPESPKVIPLNRVGETPTTVEAQAVGPCSSEAPAAGDGIARRTMLQTLLGGVGAGLALPSLADAQPHPVHQHLAGAGAAQAQRKAADAAFKPEFLDAHQLKTLEVLSEAIVPGSTDAKVAPFLDQLLAVETAQNQRAFLGALGAFDMLGIEKHGKAWKALTAAQHDGLLQHASTTESGHGADKTTIRDHFQNLRGWISGAYYSSEAGMKELGWTGNVFHLEVPGCTHPGGHKSDA